MELLLVIGALVLVDVAVLLWGVDSRYGFFDSRYERPTLRLR